jgi:hypothetical protein
MKKIFTILCIVAVSVGIYFVVKYLHMASVMAELDRLTPEQLEQYKLSKLRPPDDYNFDGYSDRVETVQAAGANFRKNISLYNPESKTYEYSENFSDNLSGSDMSIDWDNKQILVNSQDGVRGTYLRVFVVENNKLKMIKEEFISPNK